MDKNSRFNLFLVKLYIKLTNEPAVKFLRQCVSRLKPSHTRDVLVTRQHRSGIR